MTVRQTELGKLLDAQLFRHHFPRYNLLHNIIFLSAHPPSCCKALWLSRTHSFSVSIGVILLNSAEHHHLQCSLPEVHFTTVLPYVFISIWPLQVKMKGMVNRKRHTALLKIHTVFDRQIILRKFIRHKQAESA